jgi:glycosyltransferase involved in cell wall biosynthesis
MAEPLVTVVIPTYNRPGYLRTALGSVLGQTHRNLEVLVQDNASPEDPGPVVAAFNDPRVHYRRNPENIGAERNIIRALGWGAGTYVAILADDDLWEPDFLQSLLAEMERDRRICVAFCDLAMIDEAGRRDPEQEVKKAQTFGRDRLRPGLHQNFEAIALVYRSICVTSGALIRRDALDVAVIEASPWVDIHIAYLLARSGRPCFYVPRKLAQVRWHAATYTHEIANSGLHETALEFWDRFYRDRILRFRSYYRLRRALKAAHIVLDQLRSGEPGKAVSSVARYAQQGIITPDLLLYYPFYAAKLRRLVP